MNSPDTIVATLTLDALSAEEVSSVNALLMETEHISPRAGTAVEGDSVAVEAISLLFITIILGVEAAGELADLIYRIYRMSRPAQVLDARGGQLTWRVIDDSAIARGTVVMLTEGGERIEVVDPSNAEDIVAGTIRLVGDALSANE